MRWLSPPARIQASQFLIKGVPGTAKHVANFVTHQFLYLPSGWSQKFPRIEFLRVFRENSSDGGGHCQPQVRINIYFRASDAAGDFNVRLRDAGGIGAEFSAVLIDFLDQILRDAGGSVQNEGIIAEAGVHQSFLDRFETFEIEMLFAFERSLKATNGSLVTRVVEVQDDDPTYSV
jgi:hypothetical protein